MQKEISEEKFRLDSKLSLTITTFAHSGFRTYVIYDSAAGEILWSLGVPADPEDPAQSKIDA